ncbi:MAG: hypothetical protein ACK5LU_18410, partial [Pseudanabaena sp.]
FKKIYNVSLNYKKKPALFSPPGLGGATKLSVWVLIKLSYLTYQESWIQLIIWQFVQAVLELLNPTSNLEK